MSAPTGQPIERATHTLMGGAKFPCNQNLGSADCNLVFMKHFARLFTRFSHFQIFRESTEADGTHRFEVVASLEKTAASRWKIKEGALGEDIPDDADAGEPEEG